MPGSMDGLKLARFVRDRWPPIKIVATSGHVTVDEDDLPDGSVFLPKPYRGTHVVATLRELTSASRSPLFRPSPLLKFFRAPLETESDFANSFVATLEVAPAVPSGASGLRRAPVVSGASYPSCSLEDLAMRTYDFCPLFRSTIGFDRLFDLAETAQRATDEGYPPYNIERLAEDRYQITLAVAGFSSDEVSITAEQNVVTIEGGKAEKAEREFLYRGISTRHFKRQFSLADYVQVKGATFDNGLLKIELVREIPEAMKPRRIAINGASTADNVHQIEAKAA
jgi:molecular chaperone IbpA